MSDIYMPEPNMQLVRDVRERREGRTQTSDGPLLDELVDALEAAMAKLREAEAVIEKVREIVEPPKPFELGKSMMRSFDRMIGDLRRTLATYKPTNQEGGDDGT